MQLTRILQISACMTSALACAGQRSNEHRGASVGPPLLSFEPPDLTSEVGESPLLLVVSRVGPDIPDELLTGLSTRVRVKSGSDSTQVEVEVKLNPVEEGTRGNPRYLLVRPLQELRNEWHEVSVDLSNLAVRPHPLVRSEGDTASSMFHPYEFPIVRSVRMCPDGAYDWWLEVRFSEMVKFVPSDVNLSATPMAVSLGDQACGLLPNFDSTAIDEPPSVANEFRFRCPSIADASTINKAVASEADVSLVLNTSLESSGGRPVAMSLASDRVLTLPLSDGIVQGDCVHWMLPRASSSN